MSIISRAGCHYVKRIYILPSMLACLCSSKKNIDLGLFLSFCFFFSFLSMRRRLDGGDAAESEHLVLTMEAAKKTSAAALEASGADKAGYLFKKGYRCHNLCCCFGPVWKKRYFVGTYDSIAYLDKPNGKIKASPPLGRPHRVQCSGRPPPEDHPDAMRAALTPLRHPPFPVPGR